MSEILILIYFMCNAFLTGKGSYEGEFKGKTGYLAFVVCLFFGSIFYLIYQLFSSETGQNIKFWFDLNVFDTYGNLSKKDIKKISRKVSFHKGGSRLNREWKKVKAKYNYRY